MTIHNFVDSAHDFAWLHSDLWHDLGPRLTCDEYEALYSLLDAWGPDGSAEVLRLSHIQGEAPEDRHYR